jgi:hypothetical protein
VFDTSLRQVNLLFAWRAQDLYWFSKNVPTSSHRWLALPAPLMIKLVVGVTSRRPSLVPSTHPEERNRGRRDKSSPLSIWAEARLGTKGIGQRVSPTHVGSSASPGSTWGPLERPEFLSDDPTTMIALTSSREREEKLPDILSGWK